MIPMPNVTTTDITTVRGMNAAIIMMRGTDADTRRVTRAADNIMENDS
jgi:hypothetical protein